MKPPPWTAQEEETLRCYYARAGAKRVAAMLGRSERAIFKRAQVLGVISRPIWTVAEDNILRREWGEVGPRSLREKLPGRKWSAIVWRAKDLGLPSPKQGRVALSVAARAAGFSHYLMLNILETEGVRVERYAGGLHAQHRREQHRVVDPDEARAAVERWLRRETVAQAATRIGVGRAAMRAILIRTGTLRPQGRGHVVRYTPEEIDRAVEFDRRASERPGLVRCGAAQCGLVVVA